MTAKLTKAQNIKQKRTIITQQQFTTYTNYRRRDQSQRRRLYEATSRYSRERSCPVTMPSHWKRQFYPDVSSACAQHRQNTAILGSVPVDSVQSRDPLCLTTRSITTAYEKRHSRIILCYGPLHINSFHLHTQNEAGMQLALTFWLLAVTLTVCIFSQL